MISALGASRDGEETGGDGHRVTAAELVMQSSAERFVHAPDAVPKAYWMIPNDKRGF